MTRCLFLSWPGAGNQVPAAGLAAELTARGHQVIFAGYDVQRERFEQAGYEFRRLETADSRWPTSPPEDWMPALVDLVWACPDHLTDLPKLLADEAPDVLVIDCLMYAALVAAERSGIPTLALVHSAPGAITPPGGPVEGAMLPPVNAVRTAAELPPVTRLWDTWLPFPTLCTSVIELDPLAAELPAAFSFVGPITESAPPSGWQLPWPESDDRPLLVASFTTGPAWDQTSRIQRTLDALDDGRHRLLVSTGWTDAEALTVPGDAALVPFVPHAEVLPRAEAVINHAGHGTLAAALTHGLPVLCLPNEAADQPAMAARVAALGAGIALDGERATATEIREAVTDLRRDAGYRRAAARLAEAIAAAPGVSGAADIVEGSTSG